MNSAQEDALLRAFPAMHFDLAPTERGLSMRDYFAAKAMQSGLIGAVLPAKGSSDRDQWLTLLADIAYEVADSMLAARSRV